MTTAHLNRIATAVPPHDVHDASIRFSRTLLADARSQVVFDRLVSRAEISSRFSVLAPAADPEGISIDASRVYRRDRFPTTGERMQLFEKHAPELAQRAVGGLELGADARRVTHVIVTSCTGMYAPGLDYDLVDRCGLDPSVERTMMGFMGCHAAMHALKLARHIVRSMPRSRVLVVNLELCSLHFQQTTNLEGMMPFLVFADGCAASLVSADRVGLALDRFHSVRVPDASQPITRRVRDRGFEIFLSGRVPAAIARGLGASAGEILQGERAAAVDLWAVHPGGRSVLDAVGRGLALGREALAASRSVLDRFGNMSSATIMFVLQATLAAAQPGDHGCAMSFGPGLTAETMLFHGV